MQKITMHIKIINELIINIKMQVKYPLKELLGIVFGVCIQVTRYYLSTIKSKVGAPQANSFEKRT